MPSNSVRLLIAGSQAGGLIGVSGQNIEKLRNSSGATITVLAPNQLPLCASALESDRLVQVRLTVFYFYYFRVQICRLSCCFLASVLEYLLCIHFIAILFCLFGVRIRGRRNSSTITWVFFPLVLFDSKVIGSLRLIHCNGPSITRST